MQLPYKLRNYQLAASHGVAVPRVYRSWSEAADIDLQGLPETFVLKSDGGASGDGVFVLQATGMGQFRSLSSGRILNESGLREILVSRGNRARPPYFVEELLQGDDPGRLPDDVKIYSFYGEVGQILLRRVQPRGEGRAGVSWRFIDTAGRSLNVGAADRVIDDTIEAPAHLSEMVEVARHLSKAVGTPFCRVDLYGTPEGVVLGEITRAPGGKQLYDDRHDEALGRLFALASARLELDLVKGRPAGILHGSQPAPNWYPEDHASQQDNPGPWGITVRPCANWCY